MNIAALTLLGLLSSQDLSLQARAGGQFGGAIGSGDDEVSIEPSSAFAFGAGYYVRDDAQAAIWYGLQPTTLKLSEDVTGVPEFDILVHHILIGGLIEFDTGKVARPFFEAGAGAILLAVDEEGAGTEARFSFALGGGVDIRLIDELRIRTQVDLRLAFLGGGSLFCGVSNGGGGCLVSVQDVAAQGNVSIGLVLLL